MALRFADKGCYYDLYFLFSKSIELIDFLINLGISALDFTKQLFTLTRGTENYANRLQNYYYQSQVKLLWLNNKLLHYTAGDYSLSLMYNLQCWLALESAGVLTSVS